MPSLNPLKKQQSLRKESYRAENLNIFLDILFCAYKVTDRVASGVRIQKLLVTYVVKQSCGSRSIHS
jgi:hypothetical protein